MIIEKTQDYHLYSGHPFVYRELVLSREVMQMLDQAANDLPHSGRGFGSCGIDHILGKIRIELVVCCRAIDSVLQLGLRHAVCYAKVPNVQTV